MRIVAFYGPHQQISRESLLNGNCAMNIGWRRRALDALMCARKIAPFWTQYLPDEAYQLSLLNTADVAIREGRSAWLELKEDSDIISWQIGEASLKFVNAYQAEGAYYATQNALSMIASDIEAEFDSSLSYIDNWPTDWCDAPVVMLAARVFDFGKIGGTAHHEMESQKQLRDFWLWWLDEVVPVCAAFE